MTRPVLRAEMDGESVVRRPARRGRLLLGALALAGVVWRGRVVDAPTLLIRTLDAIRELGAWGAVLFVALYVGAAVLGLPGSVLTLGAGVIYGVVRGAVLVSVGATLGAAVAFLVGRHLARGWVARRLDGYPAFRAIDEAVAREGWKIVGLTRLSPAFPFNLLNYAFGLTRVSFRDFVLASWVGMMPGTVMYVYLGALAGDLATLAAAGGARARTPAEWTLYAVGLLAALAVTGYVARLAQVALRRRVA